MADRCSDVLRGVRLSWNCIPSGRQLPRTPPLMDVVKKLDFCGDDPYKVEMQHHMEAGSRAQDDQNNTFDVETPNTKPENIFKSHDPKSLLKGMTGYQLTQGDLEFIEKRKEELIIKKLQADLEDVQRLLKEEMMNPERVQAFWKKPQADLHKYPSCEDLTDWAKVVLRMTSNSTELPDLDAKSLLAMVTKKNVQEAVEEKRIEVTRLEKMVENNYLLFQRAHVLVGDLNTQNDLNSNILNGRILQSRIPFKELKKKEAKERGMHEKQITNEQLKIQALMSQLLDLKTELAQQEEAYKALQTQINIQEAKESKVAASEELQVSKSHAERRGKERKKADKTTEKLQDAANQSKTDNRGGLKDERAQENTNEPTKPAAKQQTKHKPAKSVRAAKGPQEEAGEQQSNPQASAQAVRGRRQAEKPQNQRKAATVETQSTRSRKKTAAAADNAGEEAQNLILRRSKRLASRT